MLFDKDDYKTLFKVFLVFLASMSGWEYWSHRNHEITQFLDTAYNEELSNLPQAFIGPSEEWAEQYVKDSSITYGHFEMEPVESLPIIIRPNVHEDDYLYGARPWQSAKMLTSLARSFFPEISLPTIVGNGWKPVRYDSPVFFVLQPMEMAGENIIQATVSGYTRKKTDNDNTFTYEPFHNTVLLDRKKMEQILIGMKEAQRVILKETGEIDNKKVEPFLAPLLTP